MISHLLFLLSYSQPSLQDAGRNPGCSYNSHNTKTRFASKCASLVVDVGMHALPEVATLTKKLRYLEHNAQSIMVTACTSQITPLNRLGTIGKEVVDSIKFCADVGMS